MVIKLSGVYCGVYSKSVLLTLGMVLATLALLSLHSSIIAAISGVQAEKAPTLSSDTHHTTMRAQSGVGGSTLTHNTRRDMCVCVS
jgi:hypothetical protein